MSTHPKPKCAKCRRVARVGHVCRARTPLPKAVKPVARAGKPKARNHKRSSREFVRCYESQERKKWIAELPCLVRGCQSRSTNAHAPGDGGAGYKASARYIVPLCDSHHKESHGGIETFQAKYGLDLNAESAKVQTLWEAYCLDGWLNTPDMWPGHQP